MLLRSIRWTVAGRRLNPQLQVAASDNGCIRLDLRIKPRQVLASSIPDERRSKRAMEMGTVAWTIQEYAFTLVAMAVGFLVVAYLYEPYWKVRHVPGPLMLPLIGHLHLLAMYGPDVFPVLAKRHGPIFRSGFQYLIMLADLVTYEEYTSRNGFGSICV
jgi:hypothetical protein